MGGCWSVRFPRNEGSRKYWKHGRKITRIDCSVRLELRRELDEMTAKNEAETLNASSGVVSRDGVGNMVDSDGALGKHDDREEHLGTSSDSGAAEESLDEEGMLTEMLKELDDRDKSSPIARKDDNKEDNFAIANTQMNLNSNIDDEKVKKLGNDPIADKTSSTLSPRSDSKDATKGSDQGRSSTQYSGRGESTS